MMARAGAKWKGRPPFLLSLRVGLGQDVEKLVGHILDVHLLDRELMSIGTARQGIAVDVAYQARLRADSAADELVKALNRIEGIQDVQLERRGFESD